MEYENNEVRSNRRKLANIETIFKILFREANNATGKYRSVAFLKMVTLEHHLKLLSPT